jgi:hypothetical protein
VVLLLEISVETEVEVEVEVGLAGLVGEVEVLEVEDGLGGGFLEIEDEVE